MNALVPGLALLAALLLPACGSTRSPSEIEWDRAQCRQIIDSEARQKCLDKVGR